jgi:hypothetical protein
MGAVEIPRRDYLNRVRAATAKRVSLAAIEIVARS